MGEVKIRNLTVTGSITGNKLSFFLRLPCGMCVYVSEAKRKTDDDA